MELSKEQKKEVERDLKEKVIVNAPPGSGKTETIIQKLIYISKNNLARLNDILVICFSRAAVKEIKERVEKETGIRNRIDIRTIDSFCSWVIKYLEQGNYKEKFEKLDYDDRIEYVINLIENERTQNKYRLILQVNSLKHIIIDEFQDIVGIRAKFIVELLRINRECGFSLFGDEYQAIYNYQAKDMTSDEMLMQIKSMYKECKEIEYVEQHRVNDEIQIKKNKKIRELIKRNRNNPKMLNRIMKKYILNDIIPKNIENIEDKKKVILTRKNGEVYELVSKMKDVPYKIQHYSNDLEFPAWIAYVLSDYTDAIISKKYFEEIIQKKLNVPNCEEYWNYCKEIENIEKNTDDFPDELDLQIFKENLIIDKGNYPENFIKENNKIIVSTIHKAKGREYDEVYLNYINSSFIQEKSSNEVFNNARLLYVAITRAKEKFYKYNENWKWIKFGTFYDNKQERYYSYITINNTKIITKIEIGLDGDVDIKSFIDKEIVGNVAENQDYIFNNVKEGDLVDLVKENNIFYIYHNGRKIGSTNINNLFNKTFVKANNWKNSKKDVLKYKKVRVKKIITIAKSPEFIEDKYELPYRDTGLWVGIQLEGFGEINIIDKKR